MAPTGFEIASTTTFPATTQISFGAFDFLVDSAGKLRQVSPGVTGPVMACRYALGTRFSFGSLDFIATSSGVLELAPCEPAPPTTTPTMPLGINNFAASGPSTAGRQHRHQHFSDCPTLTLPGASWQLQAPTSPTFAGTRIPLGRLAR
uniref:Uncharacterized protein n=1 Tax=Oryza barthii TaxID=65489 RepID=A0A0D3FIM6_9ORYZ